MSVQNLPDQAHIDRIRRLLWTGREFGQAAVMVGAGLSRNAERSSGAVPPFPLWGELASKLSRELYSEKASFGSPSGERTQVNPLRIASEYETVFGRAALDGLLLEAIPDTKYNPALLHRLLLTLPWSDVFTTNYDTLLERSRTGIIDRKYDVVLTSSDIVGRMKPRIVKLHGSFPSHRPFIITEEDFRTYPRRFAPFVNMVQQSIMENAFVLIGFSGDDPNFLQWSGWVRDNLGSSTPQIYLCGLLNLSGPQRRFLEENRGIVPIDLTPAFPFGSWPEDVRHARALEWFLLNLMEGAPQNPLSWPIPTRRAHWRASPNLPSLPPGPRPLPDPGESRPKDRTVSVQDLVLLSQRWRLIREGYPGWTIAPSKSRDELWRYTEHWIKVVLSEAATLTEPENLHLLYELNWRLETAMVPLFEEWAAEIALVVMRFNPFPVLLQVQGATIRPDVEQYQRLDWQAIGEQWVELAYALARQAREDQDGDAFGRWMECLQPLGLVRDAWSCRWHYEMCLFRLSRLDRPGVLEALAQWPSVPGLPFWQAKRASVYAELGELREATRLADESLASIREALDPFASDYRLLSQEAWVMMLARTLSRNSWASDRKEMEESYRDRWERLSAQHCNPWPEIDAMKLQVEASPPRSDDGEHLKHEFDPGAASWSVHFSSGLSVSPFLPGFAFLRLYEEAALPMRTGRVNVFADAVLNAARWVEPFRPLHSLACMLRAGQTKAVAEWFTRVKVATLAQDFVNHLADLFMQALALAIQQAEAGAGDLYQPETAFTERLIQLLPELLSRLCMRFNEADLIRLFDLAVELYKRPLSRQHHTLHKSVEILFKRLLNALPQSMLLDRIPILLALPIPPDNGFEVRSPESWPEPFTDLEVLDDAHLRPGYDRSTWTIPIRSLLRTAKEGLPDSRWRAILRLVELFKMDALDEGELTEFGVALWSRVEPETLLPADTHLLRSSFLALPEQIPGTAEIRLRTYLLNGDFVRRVRRYTTNEGQEMKELHGGGRDDFPVEWLKSTHSRLWPDRPRCHLLDWSRSEVLALLGKIKAWWDDQKNEFGIHENDTFFGGRLRGDYSLIIPLLARVVFPRLSLNDQDALATVDCLLDEMTSRGFSAAAGLPGTLVIDRYREDAVAARLRYELNSSRETEVRAAVDGIVYWLAYASNEIAPPAPEDLLDELVSRALARRQPGLGAILNSLTFLVHGHPSLFAEQHRQSLFIALDYLAGETELPLGALSSEIESQSAVIPLDQRPSYRSAAARLAHQLYEDLSEGQDVPIALQRWQEIGLHDPLPEVRLAWRSRLLPSNGEGNA